MKPTRALSAPPLRASVRRRRRLSWLQALTLVAMVTLFVVLIAALLVTRTDPDRYPDLGTGLWWAITTVTTVGYGDVVPMSLAGRIVGSILMFVGIGSIAFLTAVAASAIVVGEVAEEEQEIEREEREIERVQEAIFARLGEIDARLERLEAHHSPQPTHPTSLSRTGSRQG
jgi:voltage-gated potassium channel Kch